MKTKYKATLSDGSIEKVNVVSETKSFIVYECTFFKRERRGKVESDKHRYCDTNDEAKDWLLSKYNGMLEDALKKVGWIEGQISELIGP